METTFLIINIFLYYLLLWKEKKIEKFSTVTYIVMIYLIVAIMALFLYLNPWSAGAYQVSFLPQVFLFVFFFITLFPIKKCATIYNDTIIPPGGLSFKAFIFYIALITFLRVPTLFKNLSSNFILMISDTSYLSDKYEDLHSGGASGFVTGSFNFISILGGMIDEIAVFFLMYYLSLNDKKKWIVIILAIASVLSPIGALVQARRGSMVFAILSFGVYYLMFRHSYSESLNRTIRKILLIIGSSIFAGMILITISRFTKSYMDDDYATYSALYYLGQPMLYVDHAVMDPGGCRWGDRTIPLFKSFFTDGAYSYDQRILKYTNLSVDETVFTTYFGEFILDFGLFGGFALWIILIIWLYNLGPGTRESIPFYRLLPIVILINILVCGWTQSPFADVGGNLHFVFIILLYFYFKFSPFDI